MTPRSAFPDPTPFPLARRPETLLMLCYYDPRGISTVPDNVACMQRHSRFSMTVLNLQEHGRRGMRMSLPRKLDLRAFDGIVVHNSVAYDVANLRALDRDSPCGMRDFAGAKILMKQDENHKFRELAHYIGETGFDVILTCLPDDALELVYPRQIVGQRPVFSRMLTGYVTPTLRALHAPLENRPLDIGYRGSIQPLSFGRLAYEKRKIGEDVQRLVAASGRPMRLDISSRWEDRLGLDDWFAFLARCKATLGVESGASIFDLRGDLDARIARIEAELGPARDTPDYVRRYLDALADLEQAFEYNQISPRHFEAAATRTLQIMYPGRYSGIFEAGRHYLPLERDGSNLDEVLDVLHDPAAVRGMVERTHRDIILDDRYWVEGFVRRFDHLATRALTRRKRYQRPELVVGRGCCNVLALHADRPSQDLAQREILRKSVEAGLCVTPVGLPNSAGERDRIPDSRYRGMVSRWAELTLGEPAGEAAVSRLEAATRSGRPFRQRRLEVTAALMHQVAGMRGMRAVVACDPDSLPAALLIKSMMKIPVIFDERDVGSGADARASTSSEGLDMVQDSRLRVHVDHRRIEDLELPRELRRPMALRVFRVPENPWPLSTERGWKIGGLGTPVEMMAQISLRTWRLLPSGLRHRLGTRLRRMIRRGS